MATAGPNPDPTPNIPPPTYTASPSAEEQQQQQQQQQQQSSTNSFPQLFQPINGPVTADEYSKMVADWQQAYSSWMQASCAHYGALISGAVAAPLQAAYQLNSVNAMAQVNAMRQHQQPVRIAVIPKASYEIPSIWRRIAAECIDMVLLFVLRIVITMIMFKNGFLQSERGMTMSKIFSIFVNDFVGLGDEDGEDMLWQFSMNDDEPGTGSFDSAVDELLDITSQLVIVECLSLLFYTFYEVLSLIKPRGPRRVGGATIGKAIMGLKVVQHDISRMRAGEQPNSVVLINVRTMTIGKALIRSLIKNFSASIMFPASLTVFFYSYRLAVYDILAASTVVKTNSERELHE